MAMHGEHMEAQPPMGLKGGSGENGERSYQVPSKGQGGAGENMSRGDEVHTWLPGGAWRYMGQLHHHGKAWMFGFTKLKNLEHAWTSMKQS